MRAIRRYLVIIETNHASVFDKFYDYFQYSTCNFVMIDGEAFLIDSYLEPVEIVNHFYDNISKSTKCFVSEITGEVTWRNSFSGFNKINNFLNNRIR